MIIPATLIKEPYVALVHLVAIHPINGGDAMQGRKEGLLCRTVRAMDGAGELS